MKVKVAVAISGGGRSLKNLIAQQPSNQYEIAAVISSNPNCKGNDIAREHQLPLLIESFKRGENPAQAEKISLWLRDLGVEWIALAGFLRMFPSLEAFKGRIINIHPALLPSFGGPGMYGDRVHQAVLDAGESVSGASIHFVSEVYDEGPLISQIKVPIEDLNSSDAIAKRVFEAECRLFPKTLDALVKGDLPLAGGQTQILEF